jgi:hypothetical protein
VARARTEGDDKEEAAAGDEGAGQEDEEEEEAIGGGEGGPGLTELGNVSEHGDHDGTVNDISVNDTSAKGAAVTFTRGW